MAAKLKKDIFVVAMAVLVVVAAVLLLYSQDPFLFSFGSTTESGGTGAVTLNVLPHDAPSNGDDVNNNAPVGRRQVQHGL